MTDPGIDGTNLQIAGRGQALDGERPQVGEVSRIAQVARDHRGCHPDGSAELPLRGTTINATHHLEGVANHFSETGGLQLSCILRAVHA